MSTADPSRRQFLAGAAVTVLGFAAGCGDDGDDAAPTTTAAPAPTTGPPTTLHTARLTGDPFTLGIASGDPLAGGVVLWTRLAPNPLAPDSLGGMPADPVDVIWEVAADDAFARLVHQGVATAMPDDSHAVHVDVDGLDPATDYYYRFSVGEFTSPPGRTRTLPDGSPGRFGLAVVNCQFLETGSYAAYRRLVEEPLDLVVHLGDYIYEYAALDGPRKPEPANALVTLEDFRLRHASYKLDPDLRAAHARFPFVLTWDDHEVANNYAGDVLVEDPSPAAALERRTAAYRAWWEHLPVRVGPPEGPDLGVHQAVTIGDLARLHLLDERQYSDTPPCRDAGVSSDFGDCPARTGEDRSMLGTDQEGWLDESLARGGVTWNLLGNPVVLAGVDGGTDVPAYYLDTWDGFPDARRRVIEQLAGSDNPVVLTGDYHVGMVLDVHVEPFDVATEVVAPEFMAPAVSSVLFPADVSARTPHLRQQLNAHGYLAVDVEPERLVARFRLLDDVQRADSPIQTAATWQVTAGSPVAEQI